MATPFIAEIRMYGFNFPPRGGAFCNGQILAIAQNTALFSLLGTTYGCNGTTNFGLPNLQGRTPIGQGNGPGLTPRVLGEVGGSQTVTLLSTEMPVHTHTPQAVSGAGTSSSPAGTLWAASGVGRTPPPYYVTGAVATTMNAAAISAAGGNQPHENMQPYQTLNFVIALQGVYPARN
jgi:microcystin-dependent protein